MDDLERARKEIRLAAQALAESWEEINLLYSIGEILGRTVKLEDAAGTILSEISETVGADLGAIYQFDAARGLLTPIAARGVAPQDADAVAIDDEFAVAAHVFRESAPRLYADSERVSPREVPVRRGVALGVPITWTTPRGPVGLGVVTLSSPRSPRRLARPSRSPAWCARRSSRNGSNARCSSRMTSRCGSCPRPRPSLRTRHARRA